MDECHGVLVTHDDGRVECLDVDCLDLDALRHDWRVTCADVPGACTCAAAEPMADRQWRAA